MHSQLHVSEMLKTILCPHGNLHCDTTWQIHSTLDHVSPLEAVVTRGKEVVLRCSCVLLFQESGISNVLHGMLQVDDPVGQIRRKSTIFLGAVSHRHEGTLHASRTDNAAALTPVLYVCTLQTLASAT
jgi:hypothetical protein